MPELSDEMLEAIRILRSDERTKAYRDMSKSHQDLVKRLDKKDADDQAWREQYEKGHAQTPGGSPQSGDPIVGDPGSNPSGEPKGDPATDVPPPPEVTVPVEEPKPKRKSKWWGELEDD